MAAPHTIHIVDPNAQRRQRIARLVFGMGWHAEPYEDLDELGVRLPSQGTVLVEAVGDHLAQAIVLFDEQHVRLPVIGFSMGPAASTIVQAVLIGASGYLAWPFSKSELEEALRMVRDTASVPEELEAQSSSNALAKKLIATLSTREGQVLDQLLNGLSNRQIGEILQISPRTVEIHRCNLMRKLRARGLADAVRIGMEAKLQIGPPSRAARFRGLDGSTLLAADQAA